MPHRAKIDDPDDKYMDGWPVAAGGGLYPSAQGVVYGRQYSDEEEKELHRWQDRMERERIEKERKFLDGLD